MGAPQPAETAGHCKSNQPHDVSKAKTSPKPLDLKVSFHSSHVLFHPITSLHLRTCQIGQSSDPSAGSAGVAAPAPGASWLALPEPSPAADPASDPPTPAGQPLAAQLPEPGFDSPHGSEPLADGFGDFGGQLFWVWKDREARDSPQVRVWVSCVG